MAIIVIIVNLHIVKEHLTPSSSSRIPSLMTMIIITIIWGNLREDVYRVNHGEALSASAKLLALCLYFCSNLYLCSNLYFCSNFIIIIRLWSYLNQITKFVYCRVAISNRIIPCLYLYLCLKSTLRYFVHFHRCICVFVFVNDDENGCPVSRPLPPDTHCALNVSTHAPLQASYCCASTRTASHSCLGSTRSTFKYYY